MKTHMFVVAHQATWEQTVQYPHNMSSTNVFQFNIAGQLLLSNNIIVIMHVYIAKWNIWIYDASLTPLAIIYGSIS